MLAYPYNTYTLEAEAERLLRMWRKSGLQKETLPLKILQNTCTNTHPSNENHQFSCKGSNSQGSFDLGISWGETRNTAGSPTIRGNLLHNAQNINSAEYHQKLHWSLIDYYLKKNNVRIKYKSFLEDIGET